MRFKPLFLILFLFFLAPIFLAPTLVYAKSDYEKYLPVCQRANGEWDKASVLIERHNSCRPDQKQERLSCIEAAIDWCKRALSGYNQVISAGEAKKKPSSQFAALIRDCKKNAESCLNRTLSYEELCQREEKLRENFFNDLLQNTNASDGTFLHPDLLVLNVSDLFVIPIDGQTFYTGK